MLAFLEKRYGGELAISKRKKKKATKNHYTKDMGKQYYSSAQCKAIINGELIVDAS